MQINRNNYSNKPAFGITANIHYDFPTYSSEIENAEYRTFNTYVFPKIKQGLKNSGLDVETSNRLFSPFWTHSELRTNGRKTAELTYSIHYDNTNNTSQDFSVCQYGTFAELSKAVIAFMTGKKL